MPENFLYIGIILKKLLPKSKIIRIFRDPWDTAISLYKQRYVTNIPYSASFFNIGVFMLILRQSIFFGIKKLKHEKHT